MPDLPRGSSAAPTRYQTMCVTMGAEWFATTTTCRPLASVKLVGSNTRASAGRRQQKDGDEQDAERSQRAAQRLLQGGSEIGSGSSLNGSRSGGGGQ